MSPRKSIRDWRTLFTKRGLMALSEKDKFYATNAWKNTRNAYLRSVGGLCERCLKAGVIRGAEFVHHKIHLNEMNVNDPGITLAYSNLEALCRDCHAAEHGKKRYWIDQNGDIHVKQGPPS